MLRFILYIFPLLTTASYAQSVIRVLDGQGLPLMSAHVHYSGLGSRSENVEIADREGLVTIPSSFTDRNPRLAIRITYIGFADILDTIDTGSSPTYWMTLDGFGLNEVVVTAQYSPNSTDKAIHNVRIVTEEKIDRMAAVNLRDVLSNEANIRITQDAVLGSGITMMGISGQNVKIMIDGVPMVGRQNGNIDLNQINLNDIERIEMVEGPLSVNYGTDALAGTINLITKKTSKEKTEVEFQSYNETVGRYNLQASVAHQIKNFRLSLNGGRNFFNGWDSEDALEPNGEEHIADSSRVKSWDPREQYFGRGQLSYSSDQLTLIYRADLFNEKITNRGAPRAPYNETAFDDFYYTRRFDQALTANTRIGPSFRLNTVSAFNVYERISNTYLVDLTTLEKTITQNPGDQDTALINQAMSRGNFLFVKPEALFQWEIGYDINHEIATGRRIENGEQHMTDAAIFATSEINFSKLSIRPGVRYAYNTAYGAPLTPSVHARWQLASKWTLRASYARGFRAPGLKELYFNFVDINHNIVGNPDLQAEYSNNFLASLKYKSVVRQSIFQWELKGFYNDIQNLIELGIIDLDAQAYSYTNVGRSQSTGGNASISWMREHLKTTVTSAMVGLRNSIANAFGQTVFNVYPEVTANLTYDWHKTGINASIFYKYQGRLPRVGIGEDGGLYTTFVEDFHTLDATVSRNFVAKRLTIAVGAKNILDITTVASGASAGGVHSTGGGNVPVGMGRFYFLKLDFQWAR